MKAKGLQKAFWWMVCLFAAILVVNCGEDNYDTDVVTAKRYDTIPDKKKGYVYETYLKHYFDTIRKTEISDQMISGLTVWKTENDVKTEKLLDNEADPRMDAHSELARKDYKIPAEHLDIRPISERIGHGGEVKDADGITRYERDTVYYGFIDAQIFSVPIQITNRTVTVEGYVYYYASLKFDHSEFVHLKNKLLSSENGVKTYETEYKANLYFVEKNVVEPRTYRLPIYAYTTRYVEAGKDTTSTTVENKNKVWLDSLTEEASFDKVTTYNDGTEVRLHRSIILKHQAKGIDPYEKVVKNFDHRLTRANGIVEGTEELNRTDSCWTVWRRTNKYSADIENGVVADKVVTDYSLMHERCVYDDGDVHVEFGYDDYKVDEQGTIVTPRESNRNGMDVALLENHVGVKYLGNNQNLFELVYLLKPTKAVEKYEFLNPELVVYTDSVVGNIDFKRYYNDGTDETIHDHIRVPKSLVCTTNWESVQQKATQVTDASVKVALEGAENASEGYWRFQKQERKLTAYATLYDGNAKLNSWTSKVPNLFVYTREGQTYQFKELAFAVEQLGGFLDFRAKEGNYDVFDYSDKIAVTYGTDLQKSTAPGVVKVNGHEVVGYDIRNKKLIVNENNVVASLDFITKFADGTEDKSPVSKEFARTLVPTTNWTAYENNANEVTAEPNIASMQKSSKSEGEWNWDDEIRTISAGVQLNGSTQFNGWTSTDPNNIRFTRNGMVADFGNLEFRVIKVTDNTTLVSSEALQEVYSYNNTISVNYGSSSYGINTKNSSAPGKIIVGKEKQVTGHEFRNPQLVITDNNVTASLTYVTLFNDGSETTEFVSKVFNRGLTPYTDWTSTEKNNSVVTGVASIVLSATNQVTDGNWSYANENRDITTMVTLAGSTQKNGWTSIDPNSIKYTRDGKSYEFGKIAFNASEAGQEVKLESSEALKDTYKYWDNLNVMFGDNTKASKAPGTLVVLKEKQVSDYEIRDPKLVVNNDNVTASLTFVTIYNDGSEDKDNVSKSFARSLTPYTNWEAKETSANEKTGSAAVSLTSTDAKTDGEWKYSNEKRDITTVVTLTASTKSNGWTSIDPNKIVFTRNGKSHDFGTIEFSASESGHGTKQSSSKALEDIYDYTDQITVTYGGNSKSSTAPGKIIVAKSKKATDYEIRNPKLTVSDDKVTATLTFVTIYNDGSEDTDKVSKSFARSLSPYTNWEANEKNANETTGSAKVNFKSGETKTDGNWSYAEEKRDITTDVKLAGSSQKNGWTSVDPNKISYSREGKKYDFEALTFEANESGHGTKLVSSEALKDIYDYTDQITVTYGGNSKSSTAPGKIIVAKSKKATDYEIRDPKLVVSDDKVTATLTFVTIYNDGSEDTDKVSKDFARSLTPYTNWEANEANANESTASAVVSFKSGETKTDGNWSYAEEKRDITTDVKLAGSSQTNGWHSVDPNKISYSREGKKHDFEALTFNATESGHGTKLASSTALKDVYDYSDQITVTYGGNSKSSTAPGKINVAKSKQISDYEIRNPKLVVSDDKVTASLTFVTKYNDGSEDTDNVSKSFDRSLNPYTNWASTEENGNESTGSANVSLKSSDNKTDGYWSYVVEKRDITTEATLSKTRQTNGWTSVDPNKIVYTREGKKHDFGNINFNATEAGHSSTVKSEDAKSAVYSYSDKINVTFGDNTKSSTAPGTINVEKEIIITGYEISNQNLVVEDNNVTATLTFTTIYSDGTRKDENVTKSFPRSFNPYTNWSSIEESFDQTTGSANVSLQSSDNKTDGYWSYVVENRNINTTAKLVGSSQTNGWKSSDPNKIVYTREGKVADFGTISFNATETGATVNKNEGASDDDYIVYDYRDNISVTYGSNSFNSSVPGTIKVEVGKGGGEPDFPDAYGKFTGVAVTATEDESHSTWMYVVSVHFKNGTLPLFIRQNASAPDNWDGNNFTTSTDSRLNSAYYFKAQSKWINAIASDADKHMVWKDTEGNTIGMLIHSSATMWGWDDQYTPNGRPTVFTNKYSAKLSENNTVLTIYNKAGKVFATYRSVK